MTVAEPLAPGRDQIPTLPGWAAPSIQDRGIGPCIRRLEDAITAAATLGVPTGDAEGVRGEVGARLGFPADAYVLAFVGGTGVGKSSLLNALAGTPVSDASARRPTTARPVAWVPRSSRSELAGLLGWLGVAEEEVRDHDEGGPGDVAILDLPDLDSIEREHRERVEAILPRVDAVVWVTDPEKYHDAILHDEFLARWLPRLDRQVVVLNKTDRLSADDAERVQRDLERDLARMAGGGGRGPRVRVLLASARPSASGHDRGSGEGHLGIEQVREWLAGAVEAKRVVRARLVTTIAAAVSALAQAAGIDPTMRAKPFVDGAARREAIDRVAAELLRVIDLPAAERQAVAATRARARARGAGPLGAITSRIYRWSGRQARVADPAAFLARWRERGSLAPALELLRTAVSAPLKDTPPATRATLATSVEPVALAADLGRSIDRAIAARASAVPSSRVWTLIGLLQTFAMLALVFAGVWVALWVFVKFPVDSVAVPVLGQLPIPFLALVAALLAGYLIARLLGIHAGWVGRRWARRLANEVRAGVAREAETSAFAGLDRLETARRALWTSARGAGEDCATRRT
jgi:50S ribosome-binding GTPase